MKMCCHLFFASEYIELIVAAIQLLSLNHSKSININTLLKFHNGLNFCYTFWTKIIMFDLRQPFTVSGTGPQVKTASLKQFRYQRGFVDTSKVATDCDVRKKLTSQGNVSDDCCYEKTNIRYESTTGTCSDN